MSKQLKKIIIGTFVAVVGAAYALLGSAVALAATPSEPILTPGTGYYGSLTSVSVTADPANASCTVYTTNGEDPVADLLGGTCNVTTGHEYLAPIGVDGANGTIVTVKAISYDSAGLASSIAAASYTFDKLSPIIAGVTDGAHYATDVLPTFADVSPLTLTLNGLPYVAGTAISAEGHYTLVATDALGQTVSASFTIDKTAPTINVIGDNPLTHEVLTPFNDPGFSAFDANGVILTWTTGNLNTGVAGVYTVTYWAKDEAGNTASATRTVVVLDTTTPVVTGVSDGAYYNHNVTIAYSDTNGPTATLNGLPFASGTVVSVEGDYTLVVTDLAGNTVTVYFTIDKTDPIVAGVSDGAYYNTNVVVTFSDEHLGGATLNGNPFVGGVVSTEGHYTLVVWDLAGNSITVNFTVDKTAPLVTGVADGAFYNVDVNIGYSDEHLGGATLNGNPFAGGVVSTEGHYTLVVWDLAGNSTTVTFTIDKTNPNSSLVGTMGQPSYYRSDVVVTFSDEHLGGATINGTPVLSGTIVTAEGTYTLVVWDLAGNSVTLTFTIDKTLPTVIGVSDGSYYNHAVIPSFGDTYLWSATLNGLPFVSGTTVSAEGDYVLVVTDMAGNITVVNFTIDLTVPIVTGVIDGGYYNHDVVISFSDEHLGGATLNGNSFVGGVVSADGFYTLYVWDLAGNSITIHFVIDQTDPLVTGVTDGGYYNHPVDIAFSDTNFGGATLNGNPFAGGIVSAEGAYTLDVWDLAGNHTIIHFVIHYLDPVVTGVIDGAYYNHGVTVFFSDDYLVVATLNGLPFVSGTAITAEGSYTLVVTDEAGNSVTIHFVIDLTDPAVSGVTDGAYYNHGVVIDYSDLYLSGATLNGLPFGGGAVNAEGHYTLVVWDLAGNAITINFVIDLTDPQVTGVTDGTYYNHGVVIGIFEDHFAWATLNGNPFAGGTVSDEGYWTLVVTDLAGNSITIHFVIDKTAPVITIGGDNPYILDVFNGFVDPGFTAFDNFDGNITGSVVVIGVVNGNVLGEYLVTYRVTDLAGNTTVVTRLVKVVDRVKPIITLNGDGEVKVNYGGTYTELGAVAFDNYDGDISWKVIVSGVVDPFNPGVYTIVYTVIDSSGNVSYIVRKVIVGPKPVLAAKIATDSNQSVKGDAVALEEEIGLGAQDEAKKEDKKSDWERLSSILFPVFFWLVLVGVAGYVVYLFWPKVVLLYGRLREKLFKPKKNE